MMGNCKIRCHFSPHPMVVVEGKSHICPQYCTIICRFSYSGLQKWRWCDHNYFYGRHFIMQNSTSKVRVLTGTAMLALWPPCSCTWNFPSPPSPAFVKLDVSEMAMPRADRQLPAYGRSGILVCLIKGPSPSSNAQHQHRRGRRAVQLRDGCAHRRKKKGVAGLSTSAKCKTIAGRCFAPESGGALLGALGILPMAKGRLRAVQLLFYRLPGNL